MSAPHTTPPAPPAPAPAQAQPLTYVYSTRNTFSAFSKFNGKNYFVWCHNMETQLKALGQWEVINGTVTTLVPVIPANLTPEEVLEQSAWKLHAVHAYAEIVLQVDDDLGDVFTCGER